MPIDWGALTDLCDGEVSCTFQIQGGLLENCVDPYLSDFMQVFYACLPGERSGVVVVSESSSFF